MEYRLLVDKNVELELKVDELKNALEEARDEIYQLRLFYDNEDEF